MKGVVIGSGLYGINESARGSINEEEDEISDRSGLSADITPTEGNIS